MCLPSFKEQKNIEIKKQEVPLYLALVAEDKLSGFFVLSKIFSNWQQLIL